jgi:hypothetical protein
VLSTVVHERAQAREVQYRQILRGERKEVAMRRGEEYCGVINSGTGACRLVCK